MKTPMSQLEERLKSLNKESINMETLESFIKEYKGYEKIQFVRAFNSGIREEHDNGIDYYNGTYENRV